MPAESKQEAALTEIDTSALASEMKGGVVGPGDSSYDELREVFNAMVDHRPQAFARCESADDVAAAIRFARASGLDISVYCGGHGVTGAAVADGGLVIDLRTMNGVEVDPEAKIARVQGGATWGVIDETTQEHGLAVTGGRVPGTGVAGLALGSGSGWVERKFGLTCDNLLSVEVVTADGEIITASDDEHADLFWGTRGGGGNFGVVTEFEFRLHPVGPIVFAGMILHPRAVAKDLLRFYRDFMEQAPDEVGGGVAMLTAPPEPFVPEH